MLRRRAIVLCVLPSWLVALSPVVTFAQASPGTIDHVRILVRDIKSAAQDVYGQRLGFYFPEREPAVFDEGSAHQSTALLDHTYLELISVADKDKLLAVRPWMVNFLQKYEGAHSVGILVDSAEQTAHRLASQKIDAPLFRLARSPGAKPVLLVTPRMPHLPEGAIFFLQYSEPMWRKQPTGPQPNTAAGIAAVWIVVKDLDKATNDLQALGFHRGRLLKSEPLGSEEAEFDAGTGKLLLLHPITMNGPAADFAKQRGEGLMGISVFVKGDLAKTKTMIERNVDQEFSINSGIYGASFLIPPKFASGVWIEMVQR